MANKNNEPNEPGEPNKPNNSSEPRDPSKPNNSSEPRDSSPLSPEKSGKKDELDDPPSLLLEELDDPFGSNKRDTIYTKILAAYARSVEWNITVKIILKVIFFLVTVGLMGIIGWTFRDAVFLCWEYLRAEDHSVLDKKLIYDLLIAVVPSFVSLIVSILVIPKIIAEYLFNPKEDKDMVSIVEGLEAHDIKLYKNNYKARAEKMQYDAQKNAGDDDNPNNKPPGTGSNPPLTTNRTGRRNTSNSKSNAVKKA